jgi:ATP-dependent DNA helicase RecQ
MKYVGEDKVCKSKLILGYFMKTTVNCGICSYCITNKSKKKDDLNLSKEIVALLTIEDLKREIENKLNKSQRPLSLCCGNFRK